MKKIYKYILIGLLGGSMLTSCVDGTLETNPTDSMSGSGLLSNANAALVPLNGIYRSMYTSGWSTTSNTHQSFGISAYNLMADVMGEDMVMEAQGSGWFWFDALYNVKPRYATTTWRSYDTWKAYFTWIANANYIIAAEETMEGAPSEVNSIIGQAYAIRAYSYFMLAQTYARTYKGHESDPGVPLYTEPTMAGTTGQPRSSVQEVYDQVIGDINKATELLEGTKSQHISHISYAASLGIKARIASVMEDWATAKTAAELAIKESGASILSVKDFEGVNNVGASNVMWGADVIADQSGMYAGFFTHMDADAGAYGSTAKKLINKSLYAKMGDTDERQVWWDPSQKYLQEKFKFSDIKTWLGDYVWMRVEEMYLTAAEAACMLDDDTTAKEHLMSLMAKRDPEYSTNKVGKTLAPLTSNDTGSLLEEIITQRRIELWGEYGRIYDIRRLKQGFRRSTEMGWPTAALLGNRPTDDPESYMWVLTIPQKEFDGNANMNAATDQNPVDDRK